MDGVGVVEAAAMKRGCIIKGRRGGKLGRISPETLESLAAMLAAADASPRSGIPGAQSAAIENPAPE